MKEMYKRRRVCPRSSGVAFIWIVIFLVFLIGISGLMADTGKVWLVAHQLQNAADGAALAGAMFVKYNQDEARQMAYDIALSNNASGAPIQLADSDIIIGRYDRATSTFTPTTTGPNAMKVITRRTDSAPSGPVDLIFGPIFGVDTTNVSRYAIAISSGGTGAGMIALADTGNCTLRVNGTPILHVDGGDIQVNSDSDRAACIIGDAVIDAPELNVVGDTRFTGNTTYDGILHPNAPYKPDPLCPDPPGNCLPEPSWDSTLDLSPSPGAVTKITEGIHEISPGYYSGGIVMTGGEVTMQPGMYVVDGDGFQVSGNTNLCAKGIMIFFAGQGRLDLTGTGDMVITPLTGEDPNFCNPAYSYPPGTDYITYEGMTFFQARDNDQPARIVGTSQMDLEGTLYFPNNHLDVSGTSDGLGNQLIAWTIEVSGTGELTINYDGRNPAPGYHSYLVE